VKGRSFLVYAIVVSLTEQVVLFVLTLWVLPSIGIAVPSWLIATLSLVLGGQSVVLTWVNLKTLNRRPLFSPDTGARARAVGRLEPTGYVRVENELWAAVSDGPAVESGETVVVLRREGMRLVVTQLPASEGRTEEPEIRRTV
jgi:membrane-bound ClpP family serine protease